MDSQAALAILMGGQADRIHVTVFTRAMRVVEIFSVDGNFGPGWVELPVDLRGLTDGVYYLLVTATGDGGASSSRKPAKWVLLR